MGAWRVVVQAVREIGYVTCANAMVCAVYANSIIGKHLGRLGVTKEPIMSANAMDALRVVRKRPCRQFGKLGVTKEHLMCANAIMCT